MEWTRIRYSTPVVQLATLDVRTSAIESVSSKLRKVMFGI